MKNMSNMNIENIEGYVCCMIFDEMKKQIITNAEVESTSLGIINPFKNDKERGGGIFFVVGKPGPHRIKVTASGYKEENLDLEVTQSSQNKTVYLYSEMSKQKT